MTNYPKLTMLSVALAAFMIPAGAQTSSTPAQSTAPAQTTAPSASTAPAVSTSPKGPETGKQVNERKENQQDRIANGIGNGSLTAGEAGNLEKKEADINQEERDMKAMDNGHLTAADRATLQQQQNQLSKQIYKDKHNAATQYQGTQKVGERSENQQDRIAQGVKSGQLTAGEASHLENEEAAINREKRADRAADNGHLTQAEKKQLNQQQNKLSKQIYKDKHNGKRSK
jgi:hypothetical protein